MGKVVNLHPSQIDGLKVLVQQVLDSTIDLAESIGFIIASAKRAVAAGETTWEELDTTEQELLAKKEAAPK